MKIHDLFGKEHIIKVADYRLKEKSKSSGQEELKKLLKEYYISSIILEEFLIPTHNLYLDFYVPERNIAFEFDGRQHKDFVKFFHGSIEGLRRQQKNDLTKYEWCEFNKIKLVRLTAVPENVEDLKKVIYGKC